MGRKISEIMSKRLETIGKEATLSEAARQMKDKSVRHLLVVDRASGVFLGLVSDRDLKKFISPFIGSPRATPQDNATASIEVGKIMTDKDKVVTSSGDEELKSVVEKMLMKKFGCIPVVDAAGRAIGIVTRTDFLKVLLPFL